MEKKIKDLLLVLIDLSEGKGLEFSDLIVAKDYLQHGEYGLCFDTIVTQMYEYNIGINEEFYLQIEKAANMMKIPASDYLFMKELIK
jgi:hypothetical protein